MSGLRIIKTAMLFAAGFGKRMQPLTVDRPKPLIEVGRKTLLDHNLDHLADCGIEHVVVNTHYKAEQVHAHVANRHSPRVTISHEEEKILETAGGIIYALPHLGTSPFFSINGDILWTDSSGGSSALLRMEDFYDANEMDILLLLHPRELAVGYDGNGDFDLGNDHQITRSTPDQSAEYVFTGIQILHPRLFEGHACRPFSLREIYFNQPNVRIRAIVHDGQWLHIGTPEGVELAEQALSR